MRQAHAALLQLLELQQRHAAVLDKELDSLDAGDFWDGAKFSTDHTLVGQGVLLDPKDAGGGRGLALGEVVAVRDQEGELLVHVMLHTGVAQDLREAEYGEARKRFQSEDAACKQARESDYKKKKLQKFKSGWASGVGAMCAGHAPPVPAQDQWDEDASGSEQDEAPAGDNSMVSSVGRGRAAGRGERRGARGAASGARGGRGRGRGRGVVNVPPQGQS